jgi:hypothetical protein
MYPDFAFSHDLIYPSQIAPLEYNGCPELIQITRKPSLLLSAFSSNCYTNCARREVLQKAAMTGEIYARVGATTV